MRPGIGVVKGVPWESRLPAVLWTRGNPVPGDEYAFGKRQLKVRQQLRGAGLQRCMSLQAVYDLVAYRLQGLETVVIQ
jgi:hypothetical protein